MSAKSGKGRPDTRYATRYRGVSYRLRANGERTYYVTVGSRHQRSGSTSPSRASR